MWPFKKKVQGDVPKVTMPQPILRKKILHALTDKIEAGCTKVRVDLLDGRAFYFKIYGSAYHYSNTGSDQHLNSYSGDILGLCIEPSVGKVYITNSIDAARRVMSPSQLDIEMTFVDDPLNIQNTIIGKPIKFEIHNTTPYEVEYTRYEIKDKE